MQHSLPRWLLESLYFGVVGTVAGIVWTADVKPASTTANWRSILVSDRCGPQTSDDFVRLLLADCVEKLESRASKISQMSRVEEFNHCKAR